MGYKQHSDMKSERKNKNSDFLLFTFHILNFIHVLSLCGVKKRESGAKWRRFLPDSTETKHSPAGTFIGAVLSEFSAFGAECIVLTDWLTECLPS